MFTCSNPMESCSTVPVDPTTEPTAHPSPNPTEYPSSDPTEHPSAEPTAIPTDDPSTVPTANPTANPTKGPSNDPTADPSMSPTLKPTTVPSAAPTVEQAADAGDDDSNSEIENGVNGQAIGMGNDSETTIDWLAIDNYILYGVILALFCIILLILLLWSRSNRHTKQIMLAALEIKAQSNDPVADPYQTVSAQSPVSAVSPLSRSADMEMGFMAFDAKTEGATTFPNIADIESDKIAAALPMGTEGDTNLDESEEDENVDNMYGDEYETDRGLRVPPPIQDINYHGNDV